MNGDNSYMNNEGGIFKRSDNAIKTENQLITNISDEVRTTMNGVISISHFLSCTKLTEQQRDYINMLNTSAMSLLEKTNNLLAISDIESGNFRLYEQPFNLKDNIEKIVKGFWPISEGKGIKLMYSIEPFINLNLLGDSLKLNLVLNNLINNAIKFTERGRIYIRVNKVISSSDSAKLLFSVEDSGIGISDETKNTLFKALRQGDNSYFNKNGGAGIGLLVSKKIVESLNGEIWVVSKEGIGSTFYFTAEFINNCDSANPGFKKENEGSELIKNVNINTGIATILVVDDNEINRKVASAFVIKKGFNCLCASNGKQAIEMLKEEVIDLILMDIKMPEMNGFEAAKIIRENEKIARGHVYIIAMTAYARSGDIQMYIDAGMDDYISKPINSNELYKKIENFLGR
jgi:CheY-like chemotaxis protein/two-component sensor histidine kinase